MHGIPPISQLLPILFDETSCIQYLQRNSVFYTERTCLACQVSMVYYTSQMSFVCPKKACRKKIAFKSNSFFAGSKLPINQIMHLAYLWLCKTSPSSAEVQTALSRHSISIFYSHFRQLVASSPSPEDSIIGGQGVIVELDECKIAKRKYNRGHRVEGVWILGGVERTIERRTFFIPVESRGADVLLPIIADHVTPGSIIHTDLWRGYSRIHQELGLMHFTVNHSETFVDHTTGTHTNTIEGTWNGLKICIAPRNRTRDGIETHLAEFQWRRKHKNSRWEAFIDQLRDIHYD
jgi:hypothetical protein